MDSFEQDESSFGEVDVAETEELAEHNPGEPGEELGEYSIILWTINSRVWGCFHGGSFSLEWGLGKYNIILWTTRTTQSKVWGCFNGGSFSLE